MWPEIEQNWKKSKPHGLENTVGYLTKNYCREKRTKRGRLKYVVQGGPDYMGESGRELVVVLKIAENIKDWSRYGSFDWYFQ